jgi:antitoxin component YwqK of YwqJK toxin-antitoxin module
MKDDAKIGLWKSYYPDGSKKMTMETDENAMVIYHEEYFENGNKKWELRKVSSTKYEETTYHDTTYSKKTLQEYSLNSDTDPPSKVETGKKIEFYRNGKKKSVLNLVQGQKNGLYKEFHANGQLKKEVTYKNNMKLGEEKNYFSNGQLESKLSYIQKEYPSYSAVIDGQAIYYHENGNLKVEGEYKEGQKVGEWKYLNNDGSIDYIEYDKEQRFGSPIRVKKTGEQLKNETAKANFESLKNNFEQNQQVVKDMYVSKDELKSELLDKDVYKTDKKWLYNAYEIVLNDIVDKVNSTQDFTTANKYLESGINLTELMKTLHESETRDLEKDLKKETDIVKIKSLLGLE